MKKTLIMSLAVAGLGLGSVFAGSAQASCERDESNVTVAEIPANDAGVSGSVFTDDGYPGGHSVEADTGQGVSYCSQGTHDGINDL